MSSSHCDGVCREFLLSRKMRNYFVPFSSLSRLIVSPVITFTFRYYKPKKHKIKQTAIPLTSLLFVSAHNIRFNGLFFYLLGLSSHRLHYVISSFSLPRVFIPPPFPSLPHPVHRICSLPCSFFSFLAPSSPVSSDTAVPTFQFSLVSLSLSSARSRAYDRSIR